MDERLKQAKQYSGTKHFLEIINIIISLAFFIILFSSGLSVYLKEFFLRISQNPYILASLYIISVTISLEIITLPLDFFGSFKLEHKFNLSTQNAFSWFKDYIKKLLIGILMYLILINILYIFLRTSKDFWWLYTALLYFFISVVIARVFPVLIIPLFYKITKISNEPLKEKILSLADSAGVKILDIYNIALGEKTKKANAAVCGIGATKRILLSDTLIQKYSEDEIEATLAHELAHHKYQHFWKLNIYNFIFTLSGFFLIDRIFKAAIKLSYTGDIPNIMADISIFPVLMILFMGYNMAVSPLLNFISRRYEAQADDEAIALTKKPDCFADLMKKLSLQNLSDPEPGVFIKIFFYSHPPANERIRRARALSKKYEKI